MPLLSKIHPVKCWDFANKQRFPVRFPRFTVIVPDFQRNNTQEGDCLLFISNSFKTYEGFTKTVGSNRLKHIRKIQFVNS